MKLTPSYDAAIVCRQMGLDLHFAEIPDMQIANDLHTLTAHKGILIVDGQSEKQRLQYSIKISPVFDLEVVARTIADYLSKEHRLNVRLVFDRSPEKLIAVRTSGT